MCSRDDDPTQYGPDTFERNVNYEDIRDSFELASKPYLSTEALSSILGEVDDYVDNHYDTLDTKLSAEECEKIMQESESRSCANPQEHAFVHVYPPVAKSEEELEELAPEIKAIREWDDLNRLRYVHGGDLHIHDWKCHA